MSVASESGNASGTAGRPRPEFAFVRSESHDADEAAQRLHAWDQVYQQLTPGRFEGLTSDLWFESMQVFRERSNRRIYQVGCAWPGSVTFGIPLAMDGAARFCGQPMGLDAMLVLGPNGQLDFLTSPMLDIFGICVPQDKLASLDASRSAFETDSARTPNRLIKMNPSAACHLRAFALSLFAAIEADPAQLTIPGVREQIRDEVMEGLAAAGLGSVAQPLHTERHAKQRAIVQRATEYVLAHTDEPVFVERLCQVIGVSRRSMQYAFEHALGTSPVEYLRAARLHGVRRALKATPRGVASIQDIAARWGFWHLGHFTTHYRQLFGCRPSETPRPACAVR
jgi:AraC family ethanolamine operon transcriptional activator